MKEAIELLKKRHSEMITEYNRINKLFSSENQDDETVFSLNILKTKIDCSRKTINFLEANEKV